jgi:hypothetical protein
VPRHTIDGGAGDVIEDLDGIVEPRLTWRARWLLPLAGSLVLGVIFVTTFFRYETTPASIVRAAAPAMGVRAVELPRSVATLVTRLQFSGVTGLTSMAASEGFRNTYRLPDGRLAIVIEYPDPAHGAQIASARVPVEDVRVRGTDGAVFDTAAASQPKAIAWVADGMHYQLGGAFSTDELISLAEQLR